jgi:hypothetical protein
MTRAREVYHVLKRVQVLLKAPEPFQTTNSLLPVLDKLRLNVTGLKSDCLALRIGQS